MKMILRTLFVTMIAMMFASCEFVTNNDLLEQLKKDPPIAGSDTDGKTDDDTTGNDDLLPDSDELNPDVDTALTCGNDILDTGEECDGSDEHCTDSPNGRSCDEDCHCVAVCGNSILEGEEECEAQDSLGLCADINPEIYSDGEAECDHSNCRWDVSGCVGTSLCGTGSAVCSPTEEKECAVIDPDSYVDGYASCNSDCDGWMLTECVLKCTCGNGVPENTTTGCFGLTEECDDGNLADDDGCSSDCHWEGMDIVTDLAVERATADPATDLVAISWTCVGSGVTNYLLKKSRSPITNDTDFDAAEDLFNDTVSCNQGADRTINADVTWYDGVWYVAIRPMRNSTAGPVSDQVQVDTNPQIGYSGIGTSIDFGIVGYNATKDITVTLTNTSTLVDLYIDEIAIPSGNDCNDKVTIVSGAIDPSSPMPIDPGATHDVVLRYAPTEISTCSPTDALNIHYLSGVGPTYTNVALSILGESKNTPPVITEAYFSPNPVKQSDNATVIRVYYEDDNGPCDGTNDIVEAVWDMRELGGGPREIMTNPSCATGTHQYWYWKSIDVTSLADGIYVIPFELTDTGGNTARGKTSFAVYSGNILEVGDGKTYATINGAVSGADTGDIVVVHPGTYTGTGNSGINHVGVDTIVYGVGGPDKTIIDMTGNGDPAFDLDGGSEDFFIGGFTVSNSISGAIWIGNAAEQVIKVTDCRFENNAKNTNGGAIYAAGDIDLTVAHSLFRSNTAPLYTGGAVYANSVGNLMFVDVMFEDNTAQAGGAVLLSNSPGSVIFDRCVFTGNEATFDGGALNIDGGTGIVEIRNSILAQNESNQRSGAIHLTNTVGSVPTVKIYNSTIAENVAATDAGGLYVERGSVTIKDTIIFANTAGDGLASQIHAVSENSVALTIDNSDIGGAPIPIVDTGNKINPPDGPWVNHQNISDDPLFVGGTTGGVMKYRLSSGTPCLDVGSNGSTVPQYDFLGYPRQGTKNEIGAFEYIP